MIALRLPVFHAKPAAPMSEELLAQYARRTTKRPLLCFLVIAAMPFVNEVICRIAESML